MMLMLDRRNAVGLMGSTAAALGFAGPALAQNKKIVVGALPFTSHAGSFVAVERGYFADAGLDLELKFFQAAQPMTFLPAQGSPTLPTSCQSSFPAA